MTLSNAILGYEPVLDRRRNILATRLSVMAANPARPLSAARVYEELTPLWPVDAGPLLIDVAGAMPDEELLRIRPVSNCWLGMSVEVANQPAAADLLKPLRDAGYTLTLSGALISRLPEQVADQLMMTIVPAGTSAEPPFACNAVQSLAEAETAFAAGATAVIGWPVDGVASTDFTVSPGEFNTGTILPAGAKLVFYRETSLTQEQSFPTNTTPAAALEKVFKQDPSLSFRLLRYLNSAACGLRVEVQSIQHAVMMIGMKRLQKWLALLLATAARDPDLKPLMFASLRRGLLLESLVGEVIGPDAKDEAFILGVFSLLDKLFGEPFESLFERLQIPESVYDALVGRTGQYMPYLRLAEVLEGGASERIDDLLGEAFVERADFNTVLIKALGDASYTENL